MGEKKVSVEFTMDELLDLCVSLRLAYPSIPLVDCANYEALLAKLRQSMLLLDRLEW